MFFRENCQYVIRTEDILDTLQHQKIIAVIPCACRTGRPPCAHSLHKPHELESCVTFGLAAFLQVGSGLGRRIDPQEARIIFERAADSGLVHHVIYSMGTILELCNCCAETCAVIRSYRSGIPEVVRPSEYIAIRGPKCNGCSGRSEKVCVAMCPYEQEPSSIKCFGCGLCARHCPQQAIQMVPRDG